MLFHHYTLVPLAPPPPPAFPFVPVHLGVMEGGLPESSACLGADAEGGS